MSGGVPLNSGAQISIGYEIDNSREDGCSIVRLEVADRHLNSYGIAHGGIVATLLDTAAGQTACAFLDRERTVPVLTISLNISYLAPCKPGPVCCIGRVLGGGRTSVVCEAELRDEYERLLAKAVGVFRGIGDNKGLRCP